MDFEAAGLLEGLADEERAARLELLEDLAAEGVGLDELKAAVAEDRLALLPVERVFGARYTAADIEERTGLGAPLIIYVRRALGLVEPGAEDRVFSEDDLGAARAIKLAMDAGIPEDSIIELTRVLGEGMARFAATIAGIFGETFLHPGDSERDVALRYGAMAEQLAPTTGPLLAAALNAHVRDSARRGIIGRTERERGHLSVEEETVVCFVDLVGFTSLGAQVGAEELGTVATTLAELAAEVALPPVRLVKTIGDAAMFVSQGAAPMVDAALALVDAVEAAELPSLRAGLALGLAFNRAGDWYGNTVNLASRVTGVARPGSVLCTQQVRDAAAEDFAWSFAGRFKLKGVAEPTALHRARRPAEPDPEPEPERADRGSETRRRRADRSRRRGSS
ncbi:MAG TPA: adenylate cyclase regulatory domain-containing protein [Solirubrobacteraceae bacterium]